MAVFIDDELIFSRFEKRRYPEARELIVACRSRQ
jgi:hypothetical protein